MNKIEKAQYDKQYHTANKERRNAQSRAYYDLHRQEQRLYYQEHKLERKAYLEANKLKHKRQHKIYWQKNRDRIRSNRLLARYGITLEQYNLLLKSQRKRCAICGCKEKLVVDHDHLTNKVRGLLCQKCNKLLGVAQDNKRILRKAIQYLE